MANYTQDVNKVFFFISGISFLLLLLITFLMIFFLIKYNKKRHKKAEEVKEPFWLEIIWTVIPTVLVLSMFYYGFIVFKKMRYVPPDAMEIKVTGRQWSWIFEYGNGVKTDTLYLPLNKPVKLTMKTADVIHSLYVPAFRVKEDLVSGYETYISLTPVDTGSFDLFCAEYCGDLHAYMKTKVKVLEEKDFYSIIEKKSKEKEISLSQFKKEEEIEKEEEKEEVTHIELGKRIMDENGCFACHSTDGSRIVGPSFKGLYSSKRVVVENGKEKEVIVDDEYIKESIINPSKKVVKGYDNLMSPFDLRDEEIKAIIEFIKSLK